MACGLPTWMGVCVSVYVGGLSTWQMDCLRGREPTVTGTAHTVFLCVSRAFPVRLAQCDDMREGMYFWSRRGRRFRGFPGIFLGEVGSNSSGIPQNFQSFFKFINSF